VFINVLNVPVKKPLETLRNVKTVTDLQKIS